MSLPKMERENVNGMFYITFTVAWYSALTAAQTLTLTTRAPVTRHVMTFGEKMDEKMVEKIK